MFAQQHFYMYQAMYTFANVDANAASRDMLSMLDVCTDRHHIADCIAVICYDINCIHYVIFNRAHQKEYYVNAHTIVHTVVLMPYLWMISYKLNIRYDCVYLYMMMYTYTISYVNLYRELYTHTVLD
jgi:hypothetical protein